MKQVVDMIKQYTWVEKKYSRGYSCHIPKKIYMPRLLNEALDCVVYLYETEADAKAGEKIGASGFFVVVPSKTTKMPHMYVVTNAHCVEGTGSAKLVIRVNNQDGSTDIIDTWASDWIKHLNGDDLAIYPINPSYFWKLKAVDVDDFITKEHVHGNGYDIGIGDEIFLTGRFIAHDGKEKNTPVVRWGHLAMMNSKIVQDGRNDFEQESYLVEAHSISGFSGSPVFTVVKRNTMNGVRASLERTRTPLLGIDWGHLNVPFEQELLNSGMMPVIPAWILKELLYSETVMQQREDLEQELKEKAKKQGSSSLDASFTKKEFEDTLKKVTRKKLNI